LTDRYWSSFRLTPPHQPSAILPHYGVSEKQLVLEIIEVGVIEVEASS
jgi:hypothetical protein